jgi:hypothetical protein
MFALLVLAGLFFVTVVGGKPYFPGPILPGFLMHALNSAVFLASGILILK